MEEEEEDRIHIQHLQAFFSQRLRELEQEGTPTLNNEEHDEMDDEAQRMRSEFCVMESRRIWHTLLQQQKHVTLSHYATTTTTTTEGLKAQNDTTATEPLMADQTRKTATSPSVLSKEDFCNLLRAHAKAINVKQTWPITASMVLVGSSVGVITPAMPFVVEQLSLTASEYGLVVSAFALAKMAANIPSAIAMERHGRKPYMVHGLTLIALAVGGIGWASSFEELFLCRLVAGVGVSLLSGAATLMVTDLSTPLNRASTMAPIMSGFAAGTALGPALGGVMVDSLGLNPTFYAVGVSFLGVAVLNRTILEETQRRPLQFAWTKRRQQTTKPEQPQADDTAKENNNNNTSSQDTLSGAVHNAVGQWIPLFRQPNVQSILIMNGFYWLALAGGQMTLMPLIMTNELSMTASEVGQSYMLMSVVQIVGNPLFAKFIDRVGKAPAIAAGCTLICIPMAALPLVTPGQTWQLASVLGVWAAGSSMLSTAPIAYMSDQVQESERAQAIALLRTCGDVGFLVGASAIGALAQLSDTTHAMQTSAAALALATTWFAARQAMAAKLTTLTSSDNSDTTSDGDGDALTTTKHSTSPQSRK